MTPMPNIAIIYYSRTGRTQQIADILEHELKLRQISVRKFQIVPVKPQSFVACLLNTHLHRSVPIRPIDIDVSMYSCIIFCSPVWELTICPVMRSFLQTLPNLSPNQVSNSAWVTSKKGLSLSSLPKARKILKKKGYNIISNLSIAFYDNKDLTIIHVEYIRNFCNKIINQLNM
jgi:flavodoxin